MRVIPLLVRREPLENRADLRGRRVLDALKQPVLESILVIHTLS